jgi:excisionase family DNA binding protein
LSADRTADELLDALADRLTDRVAQRVAEVLSQRVADSSAPERLLSCAEAAERAGVHVETIRRAVRSGALRAVCAGRALRIAAADLDAWLTRNNEPPVRPSLRLRAQRPGGLRRPLADALAALERSDRAGIR